LFDLNTFTMQIESEKDFPELRKQLAIWRKRFPMFRHDVNQIENIIEIHIQNHSIALVFYRQTKKKNYLEDAQKEIDNINRVVSTVEKLELMAMLSQ
jgi:predicted P-loop ATPase